MAGRWWLTVPASPAGKLPYPRAPAHVQPYVETSGPALTVKFLLAFGGSASLYFPGPLTRRQKTAARQRTLRTSVQPAFQQPLNTSATIAPDARRAWTATRSCAPSFWHGSTIAASPSSKRQCRRFPARAPHRQKRPAPLVDPQPPQSPAGIVQAHRGSSGIKTPCNPMSGSGVTTYLQLRARPQAFCRPDRPRSAKVGQGFQPGLLQRAKGDTRITSGVGPAGHSHRPATSQVQPDTPPRQGSIGAGTPFHIG